MRADTRGHSLVPKWRSSGWETGLLHLRVLSLTILGFTASAEAGIIKRIVACGLL